MSTYSLSIAVDGPVADANHRSRWAFAIHHNTADTSTLMQVQTINLEKLIYRFDERRAVNIRSKGSEGSFQVASLTQVQVRQVVDIIRDEPAPEDGTERCQDWVLRASISLKAGEILPSGASAEIETLMGRQRAP